MATLATLAIDLQARAGKFIATMKKSAKSVTGLGSSLTSLKAGPLAAFGLGALGVTTAISSMRQEFDRLDNLGKTADKLGINVQHLQSLQQAAKLSGVNINQFNTAIQRMVRRLAEGSKTTKNAIESLGLNFDELAAKAPEQQIRDIADAFQATGGASERVLRAFNLFDTEGVALVNTLSQGSEELDKIHNEMEALGQLTTRDAIKEVENLNNALGDMDAAWTAIKTSFATISAPALQDLAEDLTFVIEKLSMFQKSIEENLGENSRIGKFFNVIQGFAARFSPLRHAIDQARELDKFSRGEESVFGPGSGTDRVVDEVEKGTKESEKQTSLLEKISISSEDTITLVEHSL